mmetsp:Transcript_8675/g.10380  ORF Transcript_8675/g.10380 Transcript_8675/m.10380 type:complete len:175 (+) Transcript_8675:1394-1918(+)
MAMLGILSELKNKPADDTVTIPYTSERICMHRDKHHCVICFGSNVYGRLGITEQQHQQDPLQLVTIPRLIGTNLKVQHLACGAAHILCCINGDCYSWGKCHFGQLGHGNEWMNCFSLQMVNYIVLVVVLMAVLVMEQKNMKFIRDLFLNSYFKTMIGMIRMIRMIRIIIMMVLV